MSEAYTGGCACGAIRYEISEEPLAMNDCQCRDCQHRSGTGHGSYLTFPNKERVKLEGSATHWDVIADSGNVEDARLLSDLRFTRLSHVRRRSGSVHGACGEPGRPEPIYAASRDVSGAWPRVGSGRSGVTAIRQDAGMTRLPSRLGYLAQPIGLLSIAISSIQNSPGAWLL